LRVHKAHIRQEAVRLFRRAFPERQIFLRSHGEVRFIKFSPRQQAAGAVAVLLLLGWVGAASFTYLTRDSRLAAKQRQLEYVGEELHSLVGELERLKRDAMMRTERLEQRQQLLESLVDSPPPSMAGTGNEAATNAAAPLLQTPQPTEAGDRADASDARSGAKTKSDAVLPPFMMAIPLGRDAAGFVPTLPSERIADTVDRLQRRLEAVGSYQEQVASKLAERQAQKLAEASATMERLGLSPQELIARIAARPQGMGGPSLAPPRTQRSPAFALLESRLHTHGLLMQAVHSLPSLAPAEDYYLSSRFGPRRDPFTKRWASHSGVDLAGWRGEPILAAGTGRVVKAGHAPAYGRMVEIDHGNGFRTRYGHMRKILVERGERVSRGQPVGEMGSSGRSTSTHLHWEVRLDGEVIDPLPFLKVADDVYALQRRNEKDAS